MNGPTMMLLLVGSICFLQKHVTRAALKDANTIKKEYDFIISGYWPDYRSYIDIKKSAALMTDLILFSIEPVDAKSSLHRDEVCCLGEEHYRKARRARDEVAVKNRPLNIWVSVGGAGRSRSFRRITASRDARARFIRNLEDLCMKEEINGVDFDWESPSNQQEYIGYFHLLIEAADAFHRSGLMLSLALHPGQVVPEEIYNKVDRIHLMSYDMIQKNTHHASYENAVKAVDTLIQSGCHASKIVLGIPAYGRKKTDPYDVKTYSEFVDGLVLELDNHKGVNEEILYALDSNSEFGYESRDLIFDKVRMASNKGLGGIFIWELGQDFRNEIFQEGVLLHHVGNACEKAKSELHIGEL